MSVTAKQLNQLTANRGDFDYIIKDQLQIIDTRLLTSQKKWGNNLITHDLPQHLTAPGIKKADAQRIVYSAILRSLLQRDFQVKILLTSEMARLFIAWVKPVEKDELNAMTDLISSHVVATVPPDPDKPVVASKQTVNLPVNVSQPPPNTEPTNSVPFNIETVPDRSSSDIPWPTVLQYEPTQYKSPAVSRVHHATPITSLQVAPPRMMAYRLPGGGPLPISSVQS
jgi:hypothetical protein